MYDGSCSHLEVCYLTTSKTFVNRLSYLSLLDKMGWSFVASIEPAGRKFFGRYLCSSFPWIEKRGTEKWSFGLDEIKEAAEIIIVEGEMDKLAIEAVGFLNCVSVPCGAPQKVSCIILVTDGDIPSQALAEELAHHLGKQRCWRVQWPKKDEFCCFNDANEERGTEKWLFGLDDIKEAAEIIIVEGEMDKLAMEEAGFLNCVNVPCGAPQKASARELPPWEKVSRIILATDGDVPGQALAEELARRLGKERFQL
ncbi:hypothetical protein Patl1_11524 [Pistacia atlantica]|uniref:Uncharacterized protein n=1 Tax=Pistacia atlantica TaxID=434234 RepID=A0ACC1A426_9ROSI|nr:hypothetical protein Patl1_11524 [Pistacia atlantica]